MERSPLSDEDSIDALSRSRRPFSLELRKTHYRWFRDNLRVPRRAAFRFKEPITFTARLAVLQDSTVRALPFLAVAVALASRALHGRRRFDAYLAIGDHVAVLLSRRCTLAGHAG